MKRGLDKSYFQGKKVFITGGSSGIGLEAARMLVSQGAGVAIFGRDAGKLARGAAHIEAFKSAPGIRVDALKMDVADHGDVDEAITRAVSDFGVPDILINSAGIGHADCFENTSFEKFDQVLKTNLYGCRNVMSALVPHMKGRGGHIVNVSSMMGLIGFFGYSAYSASKFALVGFSECLRNELKPLKIRVSVYCPPEVDTPMTDYMTVTSPPETRALVRMNGLMSVDEAARLLLRGIARKKFLIIAGGLSKLSYLGKISNPPLTRAILDAVVWVAGKRKKKA
jgi:3-dehydrosphinganine reductase